MSRFAMLLICAGILLSSLSCSGGGTAAGTNASDQKNAEHGKTSTASSGSNGTNSDGSASTRKSFQPVTLDQNGGSSTRKVDDKERVDSVFTAMKPLQILIGSWNGTTRSASVEQPQWIWDLQGEDGLPALKMKSEKGMILRDARLTFLTDQQVYQLTAMDSDGNKRIFKGDFSQPVRDVTTDAKKPQRTYKLDLKEVVPPDAKEQLQIVFNQQENDRYLLEFYRKRGAGSFMRFDTVNAQREGTSFAMSDTDYGEKTCVISQGLGTMQVSHNGKTYWVCCTGCKAAFEAEPEKWIAKFERLKKAAN